MGITSIAGWWFRNDLLGILTRPITDRGYKLVYISMANYLDFVTSFLLPFGLVFELPLVMIFLAKTGIVEPSFFGKKRKYAVVLIFIAAAILTPGPDILSQLFMGVPLYLLYEISIALARIFTRNKKKELTD